MSVTLESFARACHDVLAADNTPQGRARVAALLGDALRDPAFVASQFQAAPADRRIVYEDPELGFCILAHDYLGPRDSSPHDHGPSWAIYGQATGITLMSDFERVAPGKARETRRYALRPGDVYVYNEGDLHAPSRQGPTRLVRIEGTDMSKVTRDKYEVVA
jgi:hypothetical protein